MIPPPHPHPQGVSREHVEVRCWGLKTVFQIKYISNMTSHCLNPCFHSSNMNLVSSKSSFHNFHLNNLILSPQPPTCHMLPANSMGKFQIKHILLLFRTLGIFEAPELWMQVWQVSSQHDCLLSVIVLLIKNRVLLLA